MTLVHRQLRRKSLVKPIARPPIGNAHSIKKVTLPASQIDTKHNVSTIEEKTLKKEPPLYVTIPLQFLTVYTIYTYLDRKNYGLLSKIIVATGTDIATKKALNSYYG